MDFQVCISGHHKSSSANFTVLNYMIKKKKVMNIYLILALYTPPQFILCLRQEACWGAGSLLRGSVPVLGGSAGDRMLLHTVCMAENKEKSLTLHNGSYPRRTDPDHWVTLQTSELQTTFFNHLHRVFKLMESHSNWLTGKILQRVVSHGRRGPTVWKYRATNSSKSDNRLSLKRLQEHLRRNSLEKHGPSFLFVHLIASTFPKSVIVNST